MADNDIVILDSILDQKYKENTSTLSASDYFEIFVFEQILKSYELTYDQLLSGKTGNASDGGIDGFFCFINGVFLDEDTDIEIFKRNPLIELFIIQAKRSSSFSESPFEHIIATAIDIFDLNKDVSAFKKHYNSLLIEKVDLFRETYKKLAARHPEIIINCIYSSKGDTTNIHTNVNNKGEALKSSLLSKFHGSEVNIIFIEARELIEASHHDPSYNLDLKFLENAISRTEYSYIVLASLEDYYKFVTDERDHLRQYIFESNVRDYQGENVEVNKDIRQTLESDDNLDFWWFNNGITILASKATIAGKTITLEDVQVVNGLQTTNIIYSYLSRKNTSEKDKNRSVLIRIIITKDAETRDRIIKATNFQTAIPIAQLKATNRIQRDIEDYFLHHEWYYDRRKNYYKNIGKPLERIISIPYLAQAIMAIILKEPNNARARPSSLIKKESDYLRVFNNSVSPEVYLFCAKMMKKTENVLRNDFKDFETPILSNFRFHIMMIFIIESLEKIDYNLEDLLDMSRNMSEENLTKEILEESVNLTLGLASIFGENEEWEGTRVAKSKEFMDYLLNYMAKIKPLFDLPISIENVRLYINERFAEIKSRISDEDLSKLQIFLLNEGYGSIGEIERKLWNDEGRFLAISSGKIELEFSKSKIYN